MWVCILALVIRQTNLLILYAVLCHSWNVCLRHIFPHYLTNGMIFGKKLLDIKRLFYFFLQLLCETFLILRRIQRDTIIYTVCPKRHEIYFFAALLLVAACSNRLVEVGRTLIFIAHQRSVCCENQKDRDS